MKKFFLTVLIVLLRLCLVPIGLTLLMFTFFDDTGSLLRSLVVKISTNTMIPELLISIPSLALWIIFKGFFLIIGVTTVVKAFRFKTPFWQIATDIVGGFETTTRTKYST